MLLWSADAMWSEGLRVLNVKWCNSVVWKPVLCLYMLNTVVKPHCVNIYVSYSFSSSAVGLFFAACCAGSFVRIFVSSVAFPLWESRDLSGSLYVALLWDDSTKVLLTICVRLRDYQLRGPSACVINVWIITALQQNKSKRRFTSSAVTISLHRRLRAQYFNFFFLVIFLGGSEIKLSNL